jgi:FkbM family methyltransferase
MAVVLCRCGAERVYAFEPVSSNALLIETVAADNRLASKIVVVPRAVANVNGIQRMHAWDSSSMFFLDSARDGQPVNPEDSFTVQSCTLDSFVFEDVEDPPDFIKLDVEGAEELVIQGALRTIGTYNPRILVEIHGPKNALSTWSRLAPFQYEWKHIAPSGKENRIQYAEDLTKLFSENFENHFFLSRK